MDPSDGGVAACACAPDAYAPAWPPCGIFGRPFLPIMIVEARGSTSHWLHRPLLKVAVASEASDGGAMNAAACGATQAATSNTLKHGLAIAGVIYAI